VGKRRSTVVAKENYVQIAARSTIPASERALRQLDESAGDEPLRLPTNIRHLIGGAEATLAQAIIT
jgi:hypothetical protein